MKQLNLPGIISAERFAKKLQRDFENQLEFVGLSVIADETPAPCFGFDGHRSHGITQYVAWWLDDEDSSSQLH